jgi:nucleotide-binding universal stress UspA family protein
MYQKIVVPLDGSKFAECVLPHVEAIAKAYGTKEVMLVSVTERITVHWAVPDAAQPLGQRLLTGAMGKLERQAQRYLQRIVKGLKAKGIQVRTEVLLGNPAEEIVNYAERNDSDLIVIASHGRSAISTWVRSIQTYGSVADKILRASSMPVLLVKPTKS